MSEALFTATIDGVCVTVYPGLVECTAMVGDRLQRLKLFEAGDLNEAAAEFWDHVGGKPKEEDESNYQYECPQCGEEWQSVWSAQVNDTCPGCGAEDIEPFTSEEL